MGVRQPLFQRLPEIYRIRDVEQTPAGQLEAYLGILDEAQSAITPASTRSTTTSSSTCADWVIPTSPTCWAYRTAGDPAAARGRRAPSTTAGARKRWARCALMYCCRAGLCTLSRCASA
jgi:hypothetical protein